MTANPGGGGNDYVHFTEGSAHLLKAEEHFNKAKSLFMAFKAMYPALAELKFPPAQLGLAEPLTEAIPHYKTYTFPGGGNLFQRRMMARDKPQLQPLPFQNVTSQQASGYGSSAWSGMSQFNHPSFEGAQFDNSMLGGPPPPFGYSSGMESSRTETSPPARFASRPTSPAPRSPTPPPCSRPVTPTSPFQPRRLNFDTPESQKFQNMIGSSYFDPTKSNAGEYSNVYVTDESSGSIPGCSNAQGYSFQPSMGSNSMPVFFSGPTHRDESVCLEDFDFDPAAERVMRGGTPLPGAYYSPTQNSPTQGYGYAQQPGSPGCRSRPVSASSRYTPPGGFDPCYGQRGIMEQSMPQFSDSPRANSPCYGQRGIMEETMPEFQDSTQSYHSR